MTDTNKKYQKKGTSPKKASNIQEPYVRWSRGPKPPGKETWSQYRKRTSPQNKAEREQYFESLPRTTQRQQQEAERKTREQWPRKETPKTRYHGKSRSQQVTNQQPILTLILWWILKALALLLDAYEKKTA
jgi:hypothetical protein